MTTLGYGDKIPRSAFARLFAIVWILIGITTFSLITALLSSELTEINSAGQPEMTGLRIGLQKRYTFNAIVVAKNGGIAIPADDSDADGVSKMFDMLRKREIDGLVVDRFSLIMFHKYHHSEVSILHTSVDLSQIRYEGEKLSYGILLKNTEDYDYFSDFVLDHAQVISACNGLILNSESKVIHIKGNAENPLFSTTNELFWPSVIIWSAIIGCIVFFGIIYEWSRGKLCADSPFESQLKSQIINL